MGGDRTLRVWDPATGEQRYEVRHEGQVRSVAFSRDGKSLATGCGDGTARLLDAATGRELRRFGEQQTHSFKAVALSPDGKLLAAGGDRPHGVVLVWDAETGKLLHRFDRLPGPVTSLAFSPDGKSLACGSGTGPTGSPQVKPVVLWDPASGGELRRLGAVGKSVTSVAFSPDGKTLAAGGAASIRLYDTATGGESLGDRGHHDSVYSVAFSPSGDAVMTAGGDGSIRTWGPTTGKERRRAAEGQPRLRWARFSAGGKRLVWKANHSVLVREADADGPGRPVGGEVYDSALSGDGGTLATVDPKKVVRLWEVATGGRLHLLGKQRGQPGPKVALSADGRTLAVAWSNSEIGGGAIQIWDAAAGRKVREFPLPWAGERARPQSAPSLALSADGGYWRCSPRAARPSSWWTPGVGLPAD